VSERRRSAILWGVVAALMLTVVAFTWLPLRLAWHCYWLHETGARARAELVSRLEDGRFALQMTTGTQAGQACIASPSRAIYESTEPGASLEVVYFEERPGDCVLTSTIEASGLLLFAVSAGLAAVLLLLLAGGLAIHRSFARRVVPRRPMPVPPGSVRCPVCGGTIPIGLPHALSGLPGSVGWRGRPVLHAFRCTGCEILTLQYGKPPAQAI
jgi:hypothetical protein